MSFKKNKYQILKKAISSELAQFIYDYLLNKRTAAKFLFDQKYLSPFNTEYGVWNDAQVPNTYSYYSGLKLCPTYSYARIYKKGDTLPRHKDRFSCEVSTTLNLGGEPWPIYLDPTGRLGQAGVKIDLKPGDMLIYSGCELEHWREEFTGKDCGQVFLHYNNTKSKDAKKNLFDTRPMLGLPGFFKGFTIPKK